MQPSGGRVERPLRPLRPLHHSCTRSVSILGLGPLCFLFFVFPSRPLPLTPPGRPLTGRSKTLGPAGRRARDTVPSGPRRPLEFAMPTSRSRMIGVVAGNVVTR